MERMEGLSGESTYWGNINKFCHALCETITHYLKADCIKRYNHLPSMEHFYGRRLDTSKKIEKFSYFL